MKNMNNFIVSVLCAASALLLASCSMLGDSSSAVSSTADNTEARTTYTVNATLGSSFMRGFDCSMVNQIESAGGVYYTAGGTKMDVLKLLKAYGVNWIRLRIWVNPSSSRSGNNTYARTKAVAVRAKKLGLKVLLDFHYSDTWADPSTQCLPAAWDGYTTLSKLGSAVYSYTYTTLKNLSSAGAAPDMVQIGNEIDNGLFLTKSDGSTTVPVKCSTGSYNLYYVLTQASKAVRAATPSAKIMIHLSRGGDWNIPRWFFNYYAAHSGTAATVGTVDFDVIGLSYYPYYSSHKTLTSLSNNIASLKTIYGKDVVIAETSYGWTTSYSDNTGNVFGTTEETAAASLLTANDGSIWYGITYSTRSGSKYIPATVANQGNVLRAIIEGAAQGGASGVFYWGGDWIPASGVGSTWENQAMFNFSGKALDSLHALGATGN
jgi:arabinogalactan endo-1,4-beta-galactosidase